MVSARDGDRCVAETALIAAPNIRFRDVVTSGQNTIGDTVQIGFDSLCANVNEDNLESEGARMVLAFASGSKSGIEAKISGLLLVSVLLPEPLAPAMRVNLGRLTARRRTPCQLRAPHAGLEAPGVAADPQQP
jgi:hypothetical protein